MTKKQLRLAKKMAVDNFMPKVLDIYRAIYSPHKIEEMPEVPTPGQLRRRLFAAMRNPPKEGDEFSVQNRDGEILSGFGTYPNYHITLIWRPMIFCFTEISARMVG